VPAPSVEKRSWDFSWIFVKEMFPGLGPLLANHRGQFDCSQLEELKLVIIDWPGYSLVLSCFLKWKYYGCRNSGPQIHNDCRILKSDKISEEVSDMFLLRRCCTGKVDLPLLFSCGGHRILCIFVLEWQHKLLSRHWWNSSCSKIFHALTPKGPRPFFLQKSTQNCHFIAKSKKIWKLLFFEHLTVGSYT